MQLKYIVNGIGIYTEYDEKRTNRRFTKNVLEGQLDGFQIDMDERKIKQRLIIKDFSELDVRSFNKMSIFPANSLYANGVFVDLHSNIAFKIEKDLMYLWVCSYSVIHMPLVLHFLFRQRNMVFIHAAGFSIDDKGVLLPAFGGVGKTAITAKVLKNENIKMLGDDIVLLDEQGYLHSYQRPFCLYAYHRPFFPKYFERNKIYFKKLTLYNRVIRKFKQVLCIRDNVAYEYKIVPPRYLFEKDKIRKEKVLISDVYLLRRCKGVRSISISQIDELDYVVNFCVGIIFYEWSFFAKMDFQRLAQEGKSVSEYYKFAEDIIRKGISKANNIYAVDIPEKMGANETAEGFNKIILNK